MTRYNIFMMGKIIINIIKKIILLVLYYLFFTIKKRQRGLLVLTYHKVSDEPELLDPLKVSVSCFEKQIKYLKNNYTLISGDQLADCILINKPLPENSCLITFDDGWGDNYTNALPILKKNNVPAIIFIATDFIGTKQTFWYERIQNLLGNLPINIPDNFHENILQQFPGYISDKIISISKSPEKRHRLAIINELIEELKKYTQLQIEELIYDLSEILHVSITKETVPTMLTWEQVSAMSKSNITIGSHTKSHVILTQTNYDHAMSELVDSKDIIEKKIGNTVYYFCYPNGNYSTLIVKYVQKAGYVAAFTCLNGLNTSLERPFEIKRKHVLEEASMNIFGEFSEVFFKIDLSDARLHLQKIKKYFT